MASAADIAIIVSLVLLQLTGAAEAKSLLASDRPWFIRNRSRTCLAIILFTVLFTGLHHQVAPDGAGAVPEGFDFFGPSGTAFSRLLGQG
ncbi:MAG: hypothetical protein AAFP13_06100 [Pseudomonadota bacterium]